METKDRTKYIGASDIAAILGISPWCSTYQKWLEKKGRYIVQETYAMRHGMNKEETARKKYMETMDILVSGEKEYIYKEWDIAHAKPDGRTFEEDHIVELKCPLKPHTVETYRDKGIPAHYYCQVQWQMLCSGIDKGDFFAYHDDCEPVCIPFEADKKYQMEILEKAKEFWKMVENDTPPETSDTEKVLIENKEFEEYAKLWIDKVITKKAEIKKDEEMLRPLLLEFTDGLNCFGGGLSIVSPSPTKVIDWKAVCEKFGITQEDLEKHTQFRASSQRISKSK